MVKYCPHCEEKMIYDNGSYICFECETVIRFPSPSGLTRYRRSATMGGARGRGYSRSLAYRGNG